MALGAYASSEHNTASDAQDEVAAQSSQIEDLQNTLAGAQSEIRSANADAKDQYDQRYKEGQQDQKLVGGTYDNGYKDGYADAFSGFDGWDQGLWYLVKIGVPDKASLQYNIDSRYDVEQCQLMYLKGDALFSRGNGC